MPMCQRREIPLEQRVGEWKARHAAAHDDDHQEEEEEEEGEEEEAVTVQPQQATGGKDDADELEAELQDVDAADVDAADLDEADLDDDTTPVSWMESVQGERKWRKSRWESKKELFSGLSFYL